MRYWPINESKAQTSYPAWLSTNEKTKMQSEERKQNKTRLNIRPYHSHSLHDSIWKKMQRFLVTGSTRWCTIYYSALQIMN